METINAADISDLAEGLPDYANTLLARHEAHRSTFEAIVASLPIEPSDNILDVGCGDGFFSGLLLERVPDGGVLGLDIDKNFLEFANNHYANDQNFEPVRGDATHIDAPNGAFDMVWCAYSLRSLPSVSETLEELVRVTKPGGAVVIVENDRLHQVVLPWPADLEWEIYQADRAAHSAIAAANETLDIMVGRSLGSLLTNAGLDRVTKTTWSTDRCGELSSADRRYLDLWFSDLAERVSPYLSDASRKAALSYLDTASGSAFVNDPSLEVTFLDICAVGRKPT